MVDRNLEHKYVPGYKLKRAAVLSKKNGGEKHTCYILFILVCPRNNGNTGPAENFQIKRGHSFGCRIIPPVGPWLKYCYLMYLLEVGDN